MMAGTLRVSIMSERIKAQPQSAQVHTSYHFGGEDMDGLVVVSIFFAGIGAFFAGIGVLYGVSVWAKKKDGK